MKSIARIISLILVYILPFVSCSVSKNITADHEFRKEYSAEFSRFSTCLPSNTVKSRLSVYKSYLVLACPVDLAVDVYDKNRGECIMSCSLSQEGRGIARCCNIDSETGVIDFFGMSDSTKVSVQVDSLLSYGITAVNTEYSTDGLAGNTVIADTKYGRLIVNNINFFWEDSSGLPRIQLKDTSGNQLSVIKDYPFLEASKQDKLIYNRDYLAVSPDNEKFVLCYGYGGVLDIYSLKNGALKHTTTRTCINLDSLFASYSGFLHYSEMDIYTYADVFATNKRIYTAFDGKTKKSDILNHSNGKSPVLYRNVAIYDWKGNALIRILTDSSIERLCADEEHNILYGVINDENGNQFIGRLRMQK